MTTRTWDDPGVCVKCEAKHDNPWGGHHLRWVSINMAGDGWLEVSCWRCGFTWQVEAADHD